MSDWNLWLLSKETKEVIKLLGEELDELKQTVIDGYLLQHDSTDKIAVDYAHKVGVKEGLERAFLIIKKDGENDERE